MKKQIPSGKRRTGRRKADSAVPQTAPALERQIHEHNGTVQVESPVRTEFYDQIREQAEDRGKTATALMTQLLEEAFRNSPRVNYVIRRPRTKKSSGSQREALFDRFADRLVVNPLLTRRLVSFQASKATPFYRWLKYKEAFSPELVEYLFEVVAGTTSRPMSVLDPFAGTGTTLTRACARGWKATGIELLPVGAHALNARFAADRVEVGAFRKALAALDKLDWQEPRAGWQFPHLRITRDAFSCETEGQLSAFLRFIDTIRDDDVRFLFWFACLSILEDISFTRKDGQYLRWDHRSGRTLGRRFDKGHVPSFPEAIRERLNSFSEDLARRNGGVFSRNARVIQGSCLVELPKLEADAFDLVLTSPPYCNRYDYTRTYALELAFCGCDEGGIRRLRQALLSATVENKSKRTQLRNYYAELGVPTRFESQAQAFDQQQAAHEVLDLLRAARDRGELSNNNVPELVQNYFFEMAQVVFELARVLRRGGHTIMVNDNVQYHGEEVPVDLILSDFAETAGLVTEKIWVLPRGKGNSSQQMGRWGRQELRKCVYLWRKP